MRRGWYATSFALALLAVDCAHEPKPKVDFNAPLADRCRDGRFFPVGALKDDDSRKDERFYTWLYRLMNEPPLCDHVRGDAFRCVWVKAFAVRGHEAVRVSQEPSGPTIVYTRLRPAKDARSERDLEVAYRQERVLSPAEWNALKRDATAATVAECNDVFGMLPCIGLDVTGLLFERSIADRYWTEYQTDDEESSLRTFCDAARTLAVSGPPSASSSN